MRNSFYFLCRSLLLLVEINVIRCDQRPEIDRSDFELEPSFVFFTQMDLNNTLWLNHLQHVDIISAECVSFMFCSSPAPPRKKVFPMPKVVNDPVCECGLVDSHYSVCVCGYNGSQWCQVPSSIVYTLKHSTHTSAFKVTENQKNKNTKWSHLNGKSTTWRSECVTCVMYMDTQHRLTHQ